MSTLSKPKRHHIVLALIILCAAGMVYYHLGLFVPHALQTRAARGFGQGYSFGADFYPLWLTTHDHSRDPYGPETTRQIQSGLFGRTIDAQNSTVSQDYRTFAYPAFANLLFWPLALVPFSAARVVLAVLLPGLTAVSIFLWLRALHLRAGPVTLASLILLTLSSYVVLEGIFAEQIGLLVGFLLAASLAALVRQRFFLSGSLLALTLIKPQMMLLIAVYLFLWSFDQWRIRYKFALGFFFVSALLCGSSLLLWPRWISQWLQVMRGYRQYSTPPLAMYLLGNQLDPHFGPILIATLLAIAIAIAVRMRHASSTSAEFGLTVSLLLAITAVTFLPGHAVYDQVVLLPGIILIALSWRNFTARRPFRVVLAVSALAVFWQWISAPLVIALRPLLSPDRFAAVVLTLPIRTAASIPFCVLALLGLMMARGRPNKSSAKAKETSADAGTGQPLKISV
jgi:glycosyl transferase family 87